jgi:SAM-dependent methyltransferase
MDSSPKEESFFSQPFFAKWREWICANADRDIAASKLAAWFASEERIMHAVLTGYEKEQGPARPLNVLDVGCGLGVHVVELLQRHPTWRATGLDGDAAMIAAARASGRENDVGDRATFLLENACTMDGCSNDEFDCAICMNTFGVFSPDAQGRIIRRLEQVIKPGGLLFLSAYSREAESARITSYEAVGLTVSVEGAYIVATAGLRSEAFSAERLGEAVVRHGGFALTDEVLTVDDFGLVAVFDRLAP